MYNVNTREQREARLFLGHFKCSGEEELSFSYTNSNAVHAMKMCSKRGM